MNFKYHFPQKTSLTVLLGGRYQKNENSRLTENNDSSFSRPNYVSLGNKSASLQYNDKIYSLITGIGAEKDFSPSIKVGVAFKGYWDRGRLNHYVWQKGFYRATKNDSTINRSSYFEENRIKKNTNSYRLAFPIGMEVVLYKTIKARVGGAFAIKRIETETDYSTDTEDSYYQGFSLSYNQRIFLDVYVEDEITPIGNWMAKVEYRF